MSSPLRVADLMPAARADAQIALRDGNVMYLVMRELGSDCDPRDLRSWLAMLLASVRVAGVKPRIRVKAPGVRV